VKSLLPQNTAEKFSFINGEEEDILDQLEENIDLNEIRKDLIF
jgi:hypothetical protein